MESKDARYTSTQARSRYRRRRLHYLGQLALGMEPATERPVEVELVPNLELEQKCQEQTEENKKLVETIARQKAEFDNYRRRTLKEKDQVREAAKEDVIARLLPVLDNFERAIQSAGQVPEAASIRQGVEMIAVQFMGVLEADALKRIPALGSQFDPNLHEAIAVEEREDVPENEVIEVMLPGYTLGERVIRPAMVKVAKAPQKPS